MSIQEDLFNMKNNGDDFEWYPTTDEIIDCIKQDMISIFTYSHSDDVAKEAVFNQSILDCGAGDGRVLKALSSGKKYAIEKSRLLLSKLDQDVLIAGTDFLSEPLFNKKANITFSNPPYSAFEAWMSKIIRESISRVLYFVVPSRWKESKDVRDSLVARGVVSSNPRIEALINEDKSIKQVQVVGKFDFSKADRPARVDVDVVRVVLVNTGDRYTLSQSDGYDLMTDPYDSAIRDLMESLTKADEEPVTEQEQASESDASALVVGEVNPIEALVKSYEEDKGKIFSLIESMSNLDSQLLESIGVDQAKLIKSAGEKMSELNPTYWKKLINYYGPIDKRLFSSKKASIHSDIVQGSVEFNSSNAYAITEWVIKNANQFVDEQVLEFFDILSAPDNIKNYKSNHKVFEGTGWRQESTSFKYRKAEWMREYGERYALEYRVIIEGAIARLDVENRDRCFGLKEEAMKFLDDMMILASNLGFNIDGADGPRNQGEWVAGQAKKMSFVDSKGVKQTLCEIKYYKKGSAHIKLHKDFVLAVNVEVGRLKGWVRSPAEAASEMSQKESKVKDHFGVLDNTCKLSFSKTCNDRSALMLVA